MDVLRYAAFTSDPAGGNPAGIVLDARGLDDGRMQAIAAEVGYSESAFLFPRPDGRFDVRYFSPRHEVPFCGHATIASAVAYGQRHPEQSELQLLTKAGTVDVTIDHAEWDSIAYMALVTEIEGSFDILIDTEEVIDMSSFANAQQIVSKHGIDI